jgi:hypothetical protein
MKAKLFVVLCVTAALAGTTFSADAKAHKHHKHSSMTTGSNMKPMTPAPNKGDATGQGTVGPGSNDNKSMNKK